MTKRLTAKKLDEFITKNFDTPTEEFETKVLEFLNQFPQKKKPVKKKSFRGIGSY